MKSLPFRPGLAIPMFVIFVLVTGWIIFKMTTMTPDYDHVPEDPATPPDGARLYASLCASCHGSEGKGVPGRFPPLAENPRVVGDPNIPVRVTLHGLDGPIEVAGNRYSGIMPPFGYRLSNSELAALATYIRTTWGNEAGAVTTEEVADIRSRFSERRERWTIEELER